MGEQLLDAVAERGLPLLQGDFPRGGADRKSEACGVERCGMGRVDLEKQPRYPLPEIRTKSAPIAAAISLTKVSKYP